MLGTDPVCALCLVRDTDLIDDAIEVLSVIANVEVGPATARSVVRVGLSSGIGAVDVKVPFLGCRVPYSGQLIPLPGVKTHAHIVEIIHTGTGLMTEVNVSAGPEEHGVQIVLRLGVPTPRELHDGRELPGSGKTINLDPCFQSNVAPDLQGRVGSGHFHVVGAAVEFARTSNLASSGLVRDNLIDIVIVRRRVKVIAACLIHVPHCFMGRVPDASWVLPVSYARITVVHPDEVYCGPRINLRHINPDIRFAALIPAFDLVVEQYPIAIYKAKVLSVILRLRIINASGIQCNQYWEASQILSLRQIIERECSSVPPILIVPGVVRIEQCVLVHGISIRYCHQATGNGSLGDTADTLENTGIICVARHNRDVRPCIGCIEGIGY